MIKDNIIAHLFFLLTTPLTQWHWLFLSLCMLIIEILAGSGGFLLWLGLSGLIMFLWVWVFPLTSWSVQMLGFSAMGVISCIGWRIYLKRYPIDTSDPKLNRRTEQYIGRTFTLTEPIHNGRGKILADGVTWIVSGPDMPKDTVIKIIRTEGAILIVKKTEE